MFFEILSVYHQLLSRVHVTLYPALSVGRSVRPSVRRWLRGARDLWRSALFCLNFIYSIFISKSILPGNIWLIFLYCGQMHTPDSDTQKLCIHRLRVHGLCIHRLCMYRLCIHRLCIHRFCIHRLCIHRFCIHKLI